jgi:hypothetical protein
MTRRLAQQHLISVSLGLSRIAAGNFSRLRRSKIALVITTRKDWGIGAARPFAASKVGA